MAVLLRFARLRQGLSNSWVPGLECWSRFQSAPSLEYHSSVVSSDTEIGSQGLGQGGSQERHVQLWNDLFSRPSEWTDNRLDKRRPEHPDFQHTASGEALWLNSQHKPTWVDSRLVTVDAQLRGLQGPSCISSRNPGEEIVSLCEKGQLEGALDVLSRMDQLGAVPTATMYTSLLKVCSKRKALAQAMQVSAHLAKHGFESTGSLGDSVVNTLVQCGGLEEALKVFHRLPKRTVFSWTAVLSGCSTAGEGQEALRMYQCMQEEGVEPNKYTFVSLLKACGSIADLNEGKRIHAEALKYRCDTELFVSSSLIDMYAKCGSTTDARNVFDRLSQRNVVSWNAMLAAYAQHGEAEKALQLYDYMQEQGASPNDRTFVSAIHACGILAEREEGVMVDGRLTKVNSLKRGQALHADAKRKGCNADIFVGNTLVSMYGKCGSTVNAWDVFDGLPRRDVVSWNAMLTVYAQQGPAEKALQMYDQMKENGVRPTNRTFVAALQACAMLAGNEGDGVLLKEKALDRGRAIHADARKKGHDSAAFVGNSLIRMYAKCGSILEAQNVFDRLSYRRDVVSWNTMLAAYVEEGQPEKTLQLYEKMQVEKVSPDARTYMSSLQACAMLAEKEEGVLISGKLTKVESLRKGKAIHISACKQGCDADVFVGSTLVNMYGRCGRIVDAEKVFGRFSKPNVVLWNAMLTAYICQGHVAKALKLYDQMQEEGVSSNDRTFVSALQACGMLAEKEEVIMQDGCLTRANSLEKGRAIHRDARNKGYDSDIFVGNTLVSMYGKCGSIEDAQDVFEKLAQRNVVSWNAMLAAYTQQNQAETALQLYEQMLPEEGVSPNDRTIVIALQACCTLADKEDVVDGQSMKLKTLEKGRAIHEDAQRRRYTSDVFVGSTLISMYGKCGNMEDAEKVFDALPHRSVVAWNAMLSSYVGQGQNHKALQLFAQMQEQGVTPDEVTQTCISRAYNDP